MPILTPTPGQRFILKLAFGESLSREEFIEFTDPRNGGHYRFNEYQFYWFLVEEGRLRGSREHLQSPRGLLASLGRQSGKSTLVLNTALRCAERQSSCSIVGLSRESFQQMSENVRHLSPTYRQYIRVSRLEVDRSTNLVFDEVAFSRSETVDHFTGSSGGLSRVFAFSSPRDGSAFNRIVLNPPPGMISVMMHTWEVMGHRSEISFERYSTNPEYLGSFGIAAPARSTENVNAGPSTVPPAPPDVEVRQFLSEEDRFDQVIAGLDEVESLTATSKVVHPPCDLYVVVNQVAEDCLCVMDLDRLHSQERFRSDKVYRVVAVEEVEDPRSDPRSGVAGQ